MGSKLALNEKPPQKGAFVEGSGVAPTFYLLFLWLKSPVGKLKVTVQFPHFAALFSTSKGL